MSRTYTHTFKDGTKKDYTYEDILNRADEFYNLGSGSLDAVTRAGLEYIAQGGDKDAQHAQAALSHWNNPEAVKNAYYDYNKKNGIEETPPTTTPPTSVPTTSGEGKGDSKDWKSIIKSIFAAYGKTGKSVKGKYETNLAAIDEQERYAIELANQQRDEAVKRAYALNDQSQVTHGQNAERLAQMGLTNAGYGDYLTGVAYGNLVGGVERANVNADNAIRDAYYAAGQAKSQVYDTMHNELADAEKAYKDTLASIVTAVSSGEINEEQAKAIAEAYKITEDEALSLIGDAATAYKDATGETPDTTTTPSTSAVTGEAFYKDDFIKTQLQGIKSSNASIGDLTDVDAEFEAGNLTEDDVQSLYFENALKWIEQGVENMDDIQEGIKELDRLKYYEKISNTDYENLKRYMYNQTVKEIEDDKYSVNRSGPLIEVFVNDSDVSEKSPTLSTTKINDKTAKSILEGYSNSNTLKNDTVVLLDSNLYVYSDGQWKKITTGYMNLNELWLVRDAYLGASQSYKKKNDIPAHKKQ